MNHAVKIEWRRGDKEKVSGLLGMLGRAGFQPTLYLHNPEWRGTVVEHGTIVAQKSYAEVAERTQISPGKPETTRVLRHGEPPEVHVFGQVRAYPQEFLKVLGPEEEIQLLHHLNELEIVICLREAPLLHDSVYRHVGSQLF